MLDVEGLGPGSVLGGRYAVSRRVLAGHGAERWEGRDDHLQRDVTVLAFPSNHPQRDAAFDAARRAAGVRDHRLVAVLDVGVDGPVAYVVEEGMPSARNYAVLSVTGGLPSEEVRRIVGEAAVGLDTASRRGLHHGALSPESVLVTEDGEVKVIGLATSAALAEHDDEDTEVARRIDAIGLVGLVYAGLTGRWPLPGDNGGLPPAPRIVGGTPAPSEIAVGVPADLDTICRLTLNDDEGPENPGDLAGQIAPWSPTRVSLDSDRWTRDYAAPPAASTVPPSAPGEAGGGPPAAHSLPDPTAADAGAAGTGDGAIGDGTAASGADAATAAAIAAGAASAGRLRPAWADNDTVFDIEADETTRPRASVTGDPSPAGGADPAPPTDATRPLPAGTSTLGEDPAFEADAEDGRPSPVTAAGAAIGTALAGAASSTGAALSTLGGKVGGLVKGSADRAADLTAERRAVREAKQEWTKAHRVALGSTLQPTEPAQEPPAPLLPADTAEPLTREESRVAMLIVAGFLAIALAIGVWGVSRIGNDTNLGLGTQPPQTTISSPTPTKSTPQSTASSDGVQPLAIASAITYDPQGDNKENPDQAARVYDGNPDTYWQSEGYQSQNFGGLKNGVGIILDIGANAQAKQIVVTVPTPTDFQVSLNSSKSLDGATLVGESSGQKGQLKLDVPPNAKGQYIIVWFTKPAQMGGRYRAALSEVQVLG